LFYFLHPTIPDVTVQPRLPTRFYSEIGRPVSEATMRLNPR
jgi:hypothetical protein